MKVLYLLFVLCILGVYAQRRLANSDATNSDASSQRPATRSRGRTRFSITPEFEQVSAEYEEVTKHSRKTDVPRRKSENLKQTEKRLPARPTKEPVPKRTYEVKEVVDDVPREDSRRVNKKPRVVTESRFEAANAGKKDLFTPSSPSGPEEDSPNFPSFATSVPESIAEETALPAQLTTIPINAISSTEKIAEENPKNSEPLDVSSEVPKIETELKRKQPEPISSSAKPSESRRAGHGRAAGGRTRGTTAHKVEEPTTPGVRTRTRTKPSRKLEEPSTVVHSAPRPNFRPSRRRAETVAESIQEPVRTQVPSVFAAENSQELPARSRTGRKVSSASERRSEQRNRPEESRSVVRSRGERINEAPRQTVTGAPEKVELNLNRRGDARRRGRITEASTEGSVSIQGTKDVLVQSTQSTSNAPEKVDINLNRARSEGRRGGRITEPSTEKSSSSPSTVTQSTGNAPEKVELNPSRRGEARRSRIVEAPTEGSSTRRNSIKTKSTTEPEIRPQRRSGSRNAPQRNTESTTQQIERQSRVRGRSRSFLTLNEQNLEVLPLFENEPKTVPQNYDSVTKSSLGRRRSLNSAEDIAAASTKQAEVKLEVDPINEELESALEGSIRISRQESISVDSKTEKAIRKVYKKRPTIPRTKQPRKLHRALAESREETTEAVFIRKFRPLNSRKPLVEASSKEEVVNEEKEEKEKVVTEVKEKIEEKKDTKETVKVDEPKVSIRQVVRKVSQKLPATKGKEKELTNSEEAIDEEDNYPIPYKAAIQAKKGKKEGLGSRSTKSNELSVTKTAEITVTSSTTSTSLDSSSEAPVGDNVVNEDDEIDDKSETESTTIFPSTKFPRPRFSLTTKLPRSTENSSDSPNKNGTKRPALPPRKYKPKPKPKPGVTTTTAQSSTDEEGEASLTTTSTPLQKFHARFKSSRSQKDKRPEVHITPRTASKSRSYSPKAPKGLYSSRKLAKTTISPDVSEETEKPKPPKFSVETSALPTKVPPVGHTIKKSSRFSSRYRSDILSRSHRTSTAGPTYVPTVPTITPPPTSVKVEENELGMEIISFDDPIANTVPSANLISGDYLSSSPSTKTDPTVESKGAAAHTTEKPVSIIERIINSITSISTTTSPDGTTKTSTTTSGQPTKSSAILNLVSKKPKDNTITIDLPLESGAQKLLTNSPNSVEYRTTEKPTTIIEKILSSLSAIRADTAPETTTADPMQVGSNYNTVDTTLKLSSTESTSRIAKTTIPMSKGSSATALPLISESTTVLSTSTAFSSSTTGGTTLDFDDEFNDISTIPIRTSSISPRSIASTTPLSSQTSSTTLDPTNGFEEIISDQTLPKRTIDKLLALLNIVSPTTTTPEPTTTKLVVVTPKLTTFVTSNTESISTEQNATPAPTVLPTTLEITSASSSPEITTPTLFTSTLKSSSDTSSNDINSIVNPLSSPEPTVGSRILEMISTISRLMGSTLSPTTISPTTPVTSEGVSTVNLPNTTPVVSTTVVGTTGVSTTDPGVSTPGSGISTTGSGITTSEAPGTSAASVAPTTGITSSVTAGTSTGAPTSTISSVASTNPAATAANPLAITIPTATDSSTVFVTTQTNSPISSTTSQSSPTTINSIPTTSGAGTSTVGFSTTTQGTTSTEVSVIQGAQSNVPSVTPNVITSTVPSSTQTASTLLTTVNTTPTLTSTSGVPTSTINPLTEATSASTGTTGSSIITSTTKFTRETTTDSTFDVPTTLPNLPNFEVSPDRVSVFSANDISSTFVPDDPASTTVSISARAFVPGPTLSSIEVTSNSPVTTTQTAMPTSQPTVGTTGVSSTVIATTISTGVGSTTTAPSTTNSISSTTATAVPLASTPSTLPPIITTTNSVKLASTAVDATTQDVSSNTIDTNSVTDKQSLVNQTDVSNLVNPLSAGTNVSVAANSSMSSGLFLSSLPDNTTVTANTRFGVMEFTMRDGKLLRFQPNPLQNDIQSSTRTKDYFIFAVLPNNTILRKRPSMYPTKETPFLIYGVLPNNTLIQKFPNGTIVPMEPVIQVIGFDTRENPPPPPEIISNQVTSDQDSRPDNNKVSTGDVAQNTIEVNQLSINGDSTASTLPPLTEILGGRTVKAFNSIVNQTQGEATKVQTLEVDRLTNRVRLDKIPHSGNVIFRWRPVTRPNLTPVVQKIQPRLNIENVEINTISSASSSPPPPPTPAPSSTTVKTIVTTSTAQPSSSSTVKTVTTTLTATTPPPGPPSTDAPFTTPLPLTTTAVPVVTTQTVITSPKITTGSPITTLLPSTNPPGPPATNPTTQKIVSTTRVPSTTFLPTLLTTLLSTLQPQTTVLPKISTTVSSTTTVPEVTSTFAPITSTLTIPFTSPLSKAPVATANPLSIDIDDSPNFVSSTAPPSLTLMDLLSNGAILSSTPLPSTVLSSTVASLKNLNLKQKQLTEQQKKDLETLEALEKEQAAILQQLAFLTGLNLGGAAPAKGNDNLANRVIAQAMGRTTKGVDSTSTNSPPAFNLLETLSPKDSRQSKSIAAAPSVEDLVKQINVNGLNGVTPPGPIVTSTYGKTNDALLASLLKEYGVGPSTPKVLSGAYEKEIQITTRAPKITTTKRSVRTTQAPGRIMQGLNWLMNALAPPPTSKPAPAKSKPKSLSKNEVLSQQPTEITPVIVEAPGTENNVISQDQLTALVKQLEEIQKDPKKAKDLDIEALKALQNIETLQKSGIQVISASSTGATARNFVTTGAPKLSSTKSSGGAKFTSPLPLSVSNSILEDIGPGGKSTIAPVDLKIVPGVAEDLESATTKSKIPPVKLNPVPGVPDENPRIRGQLVNYAINVTKAISTFLGSAIQGAANSFQSMIGSGSRTAGNSDSSNRPG